MRFLTFYLSSEKWNQFLFCRGKHSLRVREHNILGPYVDGLSTLAVSSFQVWTMKFQELGLALSFYQVLLKMKSDSDIYII